MKKLLPIISLLVALSALITSLILLNSQRKMAYIDNVAVFNGFTYKQELESKYKGVIDRRQDILDSLRIGIESLGLKLRSDSTPSLGKKYQTNVRDYQELNQRFTQDNEELSQRYDEQVWKQINQYVKDYGNARGYDLIMGTSGSGNLMHGSSSLDITEDLLEYINRRYAGED